ncbi:MAG: ANTAR domain-containing protein [Streptosporangiales bacterium]|nr:ANTAR domain-containing protein [Streptosporangiales bacterium]
MLTEQMARQIADLGKLEDASLEAFLNRATVLAAQNIPGCAAAEVAVLNGDGVFQAAASHRDIAALSELQGRLDEGPTADALDGGEPVIVTDLMTEERWPRFRRAALRYGVRSLMVTPHLTSTVFATLGVYGVRPYAFEAEETGPVTALLAEQLAVAVGNDDQLDNLAREAGQMRRALASRAEIDQAKGIIMQAKGCDAEEAFAMLREVSQQTQVKLADVARRLVAEASNQGHGSQGRTS